jgi:uncharacterized repeat protein (TIGR01451 family)
VHLKTILAMLLLALTAAGVPRVPDAAPGSRASGPLTLTTGSRPTMVAAGGAITFTITVANASASPVAEVTLCDLLPPSVGAVVHPDGTHLFDARSCRTLAEIPAQATVTVRLAVRIARHAKAGTSHNTAMAIWPGGRMRARAAFRIASSRPLCPLG